jgi:hypothetical protein
MWSCPDLRGQQLKDQAQLDGWLRDGSADYVHETPTLPHGSRFVSQSVGELLKTASGAVILNGSCPLLMFAVKTL